MQRCRFCGQLNDDDVDECIYCGEPLFIQVDHDNDLTHSELSHQYAAKVARELLEDERRKQQPNLFDDLDDFAKELLKPEDGMGVEKRGSERGSDDIFFTDDDYQKLRDEKRQSNDNNIFPEDDVVDYSPYDEDVNLYYMDEDEDEENYVDVYEVEEDTRHIIFEDEDEDITVDHDEDEDVNNDYYYENDPSLFPENDEDDYFLDDEVDDTINDTQEDDDKDNFRLSELEESLKSKIKRNKRLENHYGINIEDVGLELSRVDESFSISGNVVLNKRTNKNAIKITVKCFNKNKESIEEDSTIIPVRQLDHRFNVTLKPVVDDVVIIIIVPELVNISQTQLKQLKNRKQDKQRQTKVQTQNQVKKQSSKLQSKKNVEKQPSVDDIKQEYQKKDEKNSDKKSFKDKLIRRKKKKDSGVSEELINNIYLEQIKDIERKIGMSIDNTSLLVKDDMVEVVGEIHIKNPDKCQNIKIATTCYDKDNKIIATGSLKINTKMFLGFDTLHIVIDDVDVRDIKRIRLYPTFL